MPEQALPLRPHILLVDDDPALRDAIECGLAPRYVVHPAATGRDAVSVLRAHVIATIILDVVLRDEDGLALVPTLRALSPAPLLIITGYGSEAVAVRALRLRAEDYLNKPFGLPDLELVLDRLAAPERPTPNVLRRTECFLDHAVAVELSAVEIATHVGVSERHLRRLFRQAFDITPKQYHTRARMDRARGLLARTDQTVSEIAAALGFPSTRQFARVCRRLLGARPSALRR
jgi:AraC-like DNA-binding protein